MTKWMDGLIDVLGSCKCSRWWDGWMEFSILFFCCLSLQEREVLLLFQISQLFVCKCLIFITYVCLHHYSTHQIITHTLSFSSNPPFPKPPKARNIFGVGGFCPNIANPFFFSPSSLTGAALPLAFISFLRREWIISYCSFCIYLLNLFLKKQRMLHDRDPLTHRPFLASTFWDSG